MASRAVERRKNGRKPLFIIMILHSPLHWLQYSKSKINYRVSKYFIYILINCIKFHLLTVCKLCRYFKALHTLWRFWHQSKSPHSIFSCHPNLWSQVHPISNCCQFAFYLRLASKSFSNLKSTHHVLSGIDNWNIGSFQTWCTWFGTRCLDR